VPASGDKFSRNYDIVAETRRKWSEEEKASIVAEAARCPNISALARRHGLRPNLIFRWRKERRNAGTAAAKAPAFVPVALPAPPPAPSPISPRPEMIEILIAGGRTVRAGENISTDALVRIIKALENAA
jgi:transposase